MAVLGATGAVGQRFVQRLSDHPDFELAELVGKTSADKRYGDAVNWMLEGEIPEDAAHLDVVDTDTPLTSPVLFSAVPGGQAGPIETAHAEDGKAVFTNAKDHRMTTDVPLIVPDLNPDHLSIVEDRDGFIVANPNCSAVIATTPLAPLHQAYGLEYVHIVTLQALSGAGYPGVPSLDAVGNVVPYIGNEEDKIETEPCKILGRAAGTSITHLDLPISATATRVPVIEGHTCVLNIRLTEPATPSEVATTLATYTPPSPVPSLHSAPEQTIHVLDDPNRPQPKRDALIEDGMGVAVGRIRVDPLSTIKLVALGSNTIRGAAGCSVLNAELARANGLV